MSERCLYIPMRPPIFRRLSGHAINTCRVLPPRARAAIYMRASVRYAMPAVYFMRQRQAATFTGYAVIYLVRYLRRESRRKNRFLLRERLAADGLYLRRRMLENRKYSHLHSIAIFPAHFATPRALSKVDCFSRC